MLQGGKQVLLLFMRNCNHEENRLIKGKRQLLVSCLLQVCSPTIAGLPIPCFLGKEKHYKIHSKKERHCEITPKKKGIVKSLQKRKALWNSSCHLLENLVMGEHHLQMATKQNSPSIFSFESFSKDADLRLTFFPKDDFWGDLVKYGYPFEAPEVKPLLWSKNWIDKENRKSCLFIGS